MGCIGLSYDDFCRCEPDEFEHIYAAYHEKAEAEYRDRWERMRMLATITIQPHVKNKMTPERLLPFPWEKKKPRPTVSVLSKEERRKRFENLLKREM